MYLTVFCSKHDLGGLIDPSVWQRTNRKALTMCGEHYPKGRVRLLKVSGSLQASSGFYLLRIDYQPCTRDDSNNASLIALDGLYEGCIVGSLNAGPEPAVEVNENGDDG